MNHGPPRPAIALKEAAVSLSRFARAAMPDLDAGLQPLTRVGERLAITSALGRGERSTCLNGRSSARTDRRVADGAETGIGIADQASIAGHRQEVTPAAVTFISLCPDCKRADVECGEPKGDTDCYEPHVPQLLTVRALSLDHKRTKRTKYVRPGALLSAHVEGRGT